MQEMIKRLSLDQPLRQSQSLFIRAVLDHKILKLLIKPVPFLHSVNMIELNARRPQIAFLQLLFYFGDGFGCFDDGRGLVAEFL